MGLEDVNGFVTKCIQLYETTVVRHGLMMVGPTGSGKTRVSMEVINAVLCHAILFHTISGPLYSSHFIFFSVMKFLRKQ